MLDPTILIFLSSGLFLGWSLGANDAANVFGTAVGSRMVRFTTAALICGAFVVLGAFVSGTGAAQTLGKLGAVNACLLYTSPSPRDGLLSRMPSSA